METTALNRQASQRVHMVLVARKTLAQLGNYRNFSSNQVLERLSSIVSSFEAEMKSSGVCVDCSELKSQLNRLKEYHESSEERHPCSDKGVKQQALKVDFKPSFGPRAGRITNLHKPKIQEHQVEGVPQEIQPLPHNPT